MTKTIRVSRTWKLKDYESYRVVLEDEIPDGAEVVQVSRQLAVDAHAAYDDYLFLLSGFTQASDLPRRDGADQGRATADSPPPASAGAGAGAGAEDPGVPPANPLLVPPFAVGEPSSGSGPGTVTESQLEALHTLTARSTWSSELVRKALIHLKAEKVEQISTDAAAGLIGKLNRGPDESET